MGDIVFGLPLIRDLRRAFPGAEITALTHESGREILVFCPHLTEVLSLSASQGAWSVRAAERTLRGRRFDIAVTTARSVRAAYVLSCIRSPVRVGFDSFPERWFFTHRAKLRPFEVVFARRYQRLAQALGLSIGEPIPHLRVPEDRLEAARARLEELGWDLEAPLIGLHIGGGWVTKQWAVENIVELVRLTSARYGCQVLLQGGPEDLPRADKILRRVPLAMALRGVGNRISEAIAEAALCRMVVGVDSGLSHAAAACGVPTIHLFGPTDERSIARSAHQRTIERDLPCRPCNRAGRSFCPEGHHSCMRDLPARDVVEVMSRLWNAPPFREKPEILESDRV